MTRFGNDMREMTVSDTIHFFFLLDRSGSMGGTRINTLNEAMTNMLTELGKFGQKEEKQVLMHILAFETGIQWLCGTTAEIGVPVQDIQWTDITPGGSTNTAAAIRAIDKGLSTKYLGTKAYRPIIVQITDGGSDDAADMKAAVQEIIAHQKTIRVGIGVENYNAAELNAFASPANYRTEDELGNLSEVERRPLVYTVDNATDLTEILKNAAMSSLKASILKGQETTNTENGENGNDEVIDVTEVPNADDPFLT